MEKLFFGVRKELFETEEGREDLKDLLETRLILDLSCYCGKHPITGQDIWKSNTFPYGVSYDVTQIAFFKQEKRTRIIDDLMKKEKDRSFFFASKKSALDKIQSYIP